MVVAAILKTIRDYDAAVMEGQQPADVSKRYDAGMATLFDLSQSRQQWFTASENALRMKFEYLIRKKILDIETQFVTKDVK